MKICKVETKKEVVNTIYEVCESKYCCEKMEEWLKISTYHDNNTLLYDTDTGRFEIRVRAESNYNCGDDLKADEELNFCPFCGERLQTPTPVPDVTISKPKPKKKRFLRKKA